MPLSLKVGDTVKVIAGKDKGKTGKIIRVNRETGRAFVEKVNMVKRHSKPTQKSPQGGIIEKEASINISNIMYFDEKSQKTMRVGAKMLKDNKKVRLMKKAGQTVELKN